MTYIDVEYDWDKIILNKDKQISNLVSYFQPNPPYYSSIKALCKDSSEKLRIQELLKNFNIGISAFNPNNTVIAFHSIGSVRWYPSELIEEESDLKSIINWIVTNPSFATHRDQEDYLWMYSGINFQYSCFINNRWVIMELEDHVTLRPT